MLIGFLPFGNDLRNGPIPTSSFISRSQASLKNIDNLELIPLFILHRVHATPSELFVLRSFQLDLTSKLRFPVFVIFVCLMESVSIFNMTYVLQAGYGCTSIWATCSKA